MAFIKWLLFLVMIATTKGYPKWQARNSSVSEEILKTILETFYVNNSFPNPVFIFGDFNKFIDGVSIIQINDFLTFENYRIGPSSKFKPSSILLMEESPEKILSHLLLLWTKRLWDNMIPFFIVGENPASCGNSRSILGEMWKMEILNPIYICAQSINNTSEIYTLNGITNYAPYPWEKIEELDDLNIFRQNFDPNFSCKHLTYDKTKILNGYPIVVVDSTEEGSGWMSGINYFDEWAAFTRVADKAVRNRIIALNSSGHLEFERGMDFMIKRIYEGTADIILQSSEIGSLLDYPYLFTHEKDEIVAVVKLKAEIVTLEKIYRLWSTPVLIAVAFAVALLFLILMIKTWSFGSALLDLPRLLTYTSIQTDNRYQSFRIYFATMLIFMVISNGVFQGKIAAFLTTREKSSAPKSIHALIRLGYHMYTHQGITKWAKKGCPRCEFKKVSTFDKCIELVLINTKSVCLITRIEYESKYIHLPIEHVEEPLSPVLVNLKCRKNWSLHNRFNGMMIKVVESGLNNFWEMQETSIPKTKRQSVEAEWSTAEYRPVRLMKLTFAFQLLAAGLSLATIIFLLELCWASSVDRH